MLPWVRGLLAENPDSAVWLTHAVVRDPEWVWGYAALGQPMPLPPPQGLDLVPLGRSYLARIGAALAGGDRVHLEVRQGDPAAILIAVAQETGADLIALSTHGRTGLARIVLGSVAEQVLHRTTRPLLLIRPDARGLSGAAETRAAAGRP